MLQSSGQVKVKITLKHLFAGILFAAILFMVLRPITDADFWWHLATGRWMAETGQIPASDPFSHTANGKPWTAHEWLTEKGMYALYQAGGFPLLVLVFSVLITAAYGFAYFRSPVNSRPYLAGFSVLLAAAMSAPLWGVRPQMLTLLFSSGFLFLLDRYQSNRNWLLLACLPLLMLAWVNLHAGYFIGLVLIGVYLLADILRYLAARLKKHAPPVALLPNAGRLAASLAGTVLATLANPQGARLILYPFQTLSDPSMQKYIQEWYPPDFRQGIWLPFLLGLALALLFSVLGRKKLTITQALLLFVFAGLGLRSMRHIPLFAITAAPILATLAQQVIPIRGTDSVDGRRSWIFSILLLLSLIPVGLRFLQVNRGQEEAERQIYPAAAVSWIEENHPKGNLFNSYTWGGYLIWHLSPDYPVYIDGRADLYGPDFFEQFAGIYQARSDYQDDFKKNNIHLALVEVDSEIAAVLQQKKDWRIAFQDETSIILIQD